MKTNKQSIEKIKEFEGLRLVAYKCPAGVYTIGYGHTRGVRAGQRISKKQAEDMLLSDLEPVERHISGLNLQLTQSQFDALVSFAFNLGTGALDNSTLLKRIRANESVKAIQFEFRKWIYADRKKLKGLEKRREWEATLWAR